MNAENIIIDKIILIDYPVIELEKGKEVQFMSEQKPKIECAEAVIRRFSEFIKNASKGMLGDIMWRTEMSKLFGNERMWHFTKDEAFRANPQLEQEFLEAYQSGGLSRLKAVFIERLYQTTDAKNLYGISNVIEKIIAFE